jgi:hypothetical protein
MDLFTGQSEPAATNTPVGRSVHWMSCVFLSFDIIWVHHSSFLLAADHYIIIIFGLFLVVFSWT